MGAKTVGNNIFTLEILRAKHGDCLMLHYGTTDEPALALIDGGPSGVYASFLKPRLHALRLERGLPPEQSLPIDLCMLSHIDDDHVLGLRDLTRELVQAREDNKAELVHILDLWHNAFDDITKNDSTEIAAAVADRFGPAALDGELPDDPGMNPSVMMVLASVNNGRQLRDNAVKLGIDRNVDTDGEMIVATDHSEPLDMGSGLTFTIIGPMLPEIEALQADHAKWVAEHPDEVATSKEFLASFDDDSVSNLSSIVVLAESGGKTILLTGDARGDKILEGMEFVGAVAPGDSIHVDVLKCPHHGSIRNLDTVFFERISADHYVFSASGKFGNPDRETLEMLAEVRGDDDYRVHLTYPVVEIDANHRKDWESHNDTPWDAETQSLAAFLRSNPAFEERLVIAGEDELHLIDLAGE
jgi:hypothetical protein